MWRRAVFGAVVALQLVLLVGAYATPVSPFGFQMFPESSDWRAEIVRVGGDGARRPVDDGTWEYRWRELVPGNGLGDPDARHHASAGVASTLHLLQEALDWVAANTPDDVTTRYLEARVTVWDNGRAPATRIVRSATRELDRGAR